MLYPIKARGVICHDGPFISLIQVGDGVFIGLNDGTVASPNFLNRVIASKYTPAGAKPLQAPACNVSNEGRVISVYECTQAREFAIYVGLLSQTLHTVCPQGYAIWAGIFGHATMLEDHRRILEILSEACSVRHLRSKYLEFEIPAMFLYACKIIPPCGLVH